MNDANWATALVLVGVLVHQWKSERDKKIAAREVASMAIAAAKNVADETRTAALVLGQKTDEVKTTLAANAAMAADHAAVSMGELKTVHTLVNSAATKAQAQIRKLTALVNALRQENNVMKVAAARRPPGKRR